MKPEDSASIGDVALPTEDLSPPFVCFLEPPMASIDGVEKVIVVAVASALVLSVLYAMAGWLS